MRQSKEPIKEPRPEEDGEGKKEVKLELVKTLFQTPKELMPELTNIPLNLVPSLSRMVTNEVGMRMLADRMARKRNKPQLLSEILRYSIYQHRRSVRGDHKMALATLTQEELSARIDEELGEAEDM
ncbi:hypothetical protein KKE60_06485 [Patescibacteria group bacterium]|nr:hypothetical protein [Patescibacteria group bacterium]